MKLTDSVMPVSEIQALYQEKKAEIEARTTEFRSIWLHATDQQIFEELVFCLLTPQSKAETCLATMENLTRTHLLNHASPEVLSEAIRCVRFRHTKARHIVAARSQLLHNKEPLRVLLAGFPDPLQTREWLITTVKGLGYKEASHFLRNIGKGENLAILDRHILRHLVSYEVIPKYPSTLSRAHYLQIEAKTAAFAHSIGIPLEHLDLLFWFMGTGKILK